MKASNLEPTISVRLIALCGAMSLIGFSFQAALAQVNTITVQVNRPGAKIAPTQFGLFFEDINFAADGGIYPERVKNRSFEFPDPMMGWKRIERDGAKGAVYVGSGQIRWDIVRDCNAVKTSADKSRAYDLT